MIWTEEAIEELKKMWARGMTTGQIAKALNVTKNSIIGKVHRLCLEARPSPIKRKSDNATTKNDTTTEKQSGASSKSVAKEKNVTKQCKATKEIVSPSNSDIENKKAEPAFCQKPEERNIPLVKLDNHTCRWPLGDPKDDDFCFCGKRVKSGQTYCEEHSAVAYVKVTNKKI